MSGATSTTTAMVSPEAATTTRAAVLALQRRFQRFEGEVRPHVSAEDIARLQQDVMRPLEQARGLAGVEPNSMTETEWRGCWNIIGAVARSWESIKREWSSPTRIVSVPLQRAIEGAQQVVQAAEELAPRLGVAAAAGMVIAAGAGLWVLSEIFGD